jgi:hypothetical protein
MNNTYEIDSSKYVAMIGNIQSGKTNELINYCYMSVNYYKIPVVFILRNIKQDLLQLLNRFEEHGVLNKSKLLIKSIYQFKDNIADFLKECGIIVLLCNTTHLSKIIVSLKEYSGLYNVCIDEVDFSIKSGGITSPIDLKMKIIKDNANHILGATATPFALFSTEKNLSKIKKIKNNSNYKGVETLEINFVEPIIIKSINRFPHCDYLTIKKVYSECLKKDTCVLLHSVVKEKVYHKLLMNYLCDTFKTFTVLVYNGDGIFVRTPGNNILAKSRSYNQFKQLIRKYSFEDNIHIFQNYGISEVLQLLKENSITHISIISGNLASRGISFVSSDYLMHLTDQYFHPSKSSHGENLLQSLRILGCYKDNKQLTLWCSKGTWKNIIQQHEMINKMVNSCEDNINWLAKIQKLNIKKPERTPTRPRLTKNVLWNNGTIKISLLSSSENSE